MTKLKQTLLGSLAGGVNGVNATTATTGAAQDVDAEAITAHAARASTHVTPS
jgi:hypothetical protein